LKIPLNLYNDIYVELFRKGIILSDIPVLQLAKDEKLRERISIFMPEIVGKFDENNRKLVEDFLKALIDNSNKVSQGLKGEIPDIKFAIVSAAITIINEWTPDEKYLANIIKKIPEAYRDSQYIYINPTDEEIKSLTSGTPDNIIKPIKEYIKTSLKVKNINERNVALSIFEYDFVVSPQERAIKFLFNSGAEDKAKDIIMEKISKIFPDADITLIDNKITVSHVLQVDTKYLSGSDFIAEFNINPSSVDIIDKVSVTIKTPLGTMKYTAPTKWSNLQFTANNILSGGKISSLLETYGEKIENLIHVAKSLHYTISTPEPPEDKYYLLELTKKQNNDVATVKVSLFTVRQPNSTTDSVGFSGEIRINTQNIKIPVEKIKEIQAKHNIDEKKLTITPEAIIYKDERDDVKGEYIDKWLVEFDNIFKELEELKENTIKTLTDPIIYLAEYTLLAPISKNGSDIIDEISKTMKQPSGDVIRELMDVLSKEYIEVKPTDIVTSPAKIIDELISAGTLSVNENLEPELNGKPIREILKPYEEKMSKNHNLDNAIKALASYIINRHFELKSRTVLEDIKYKTGLNIETIKKYIELNGPFDIAVLKMKVGDKTLWETLPVELRQAIPYRMSPEDLELLLNAPNIPKTIEDLIVITDAYCQASGPKQCTDLIVKKLINNLQLPKTAKIVETDTEKYIDIRNLYKIQLEGIDKDKMEFKFIIHDTIAKKTYKVQAKTITQALYKLAEEEYASTSV